MFVTSPNDNTRTGVPVRYSFSLNGTSFGSLGIGEDRVYSISPISCKAEPLEGKFDVSELSCSFVDTDGALWRLFGRGTYNLASDFSATVHIGGTMDYRSYGPYDSDAGSMLRTVRTSGNGSSYTMHTGRIYGVSRRNRITTLTSRNNMARVADMEWRFPYQEIIFIPNNIYGSNVFFNENYATTYPAMTFDANSEGAFRTYVYVGTMDSPNAYATLSGRGSMGLCGSQGFKFAGEDFYLSGNRYLFNGSWLGTMQGALIGTETFGTIVDEYFAKAQAYGFANVDEARAAISKTAGGTYTYINKMRLTPVGDGPDYTFGTRMAFQQCDFRLAGNPSVLWREMLTGLGVTPYFGTNDIDALSYGSARRITAYQYHESQIDPKGGKVLPYIKSLIEPLQARFSVGQANTLRLHLYGPRTLGNTFDGTITAGDVLYSEGYADSEDMVNRVILFYGYNQDTGSYTKKQEYKGTNWSYSFDNVKEIEAPWVNNDNDARIMTQRLMSRFMNGASRVRVEAPLNKAGLDVGTMVLVNSPDLDLVNVPFEVTAWEKDFGKEKIVSLDLINAESIYQKRGYAHWDYATTRPTNVSGTSIAGWGTNGTTPGINGTKFGQRFVWF